MTTPSQPHPDDSWAELYSELGLEPETVASKAAIAQPMPDPEYVAEANEPDSAGVFAESFEVEEGEGDSEGEGEPEGDATEGEGEASDEGDPNKKKRRRRRRRRGVKKDDDTEASTEGEEAEDGEAAVAVLDEEDGPGPEATRELIANWDVPSWGEIVAGLFRPAGNNNR